MTKDDVRLAVELFYLPYEHGSIGLRMVQDFLWLQRNVRRAVIPANGSKAKKKECQDRVNSIQNFHGFHQVLELDINIFKSCFAILLSMF